MRITAIKTHKITSTDTNILNIVDRYIFELKEDSVVAVTSKIVSICEGRVVKIGEIEKDELIKREAEYYLAKNTSKYGYLFTIKNSMLVPFAGIDESNANGYYVLLPKDPQKSANSVREFLQEKFNLKQVGVIITDSKTTPLRWGVTGWAVAHSGFLALNDLIGKPDIFGRALHFTKVNVMDGLASAAVLEMGESDNQTPLAIVEDVPFVQFQDRNPNEEELKGLKIALDDDLYAPLLQSVEWEKGSVEQSK